MDYSLLKIINDFTASRSFVTPIAVVCSTYLIFTLPFGVFFLGKKWKRALLALFVSVGSAYGVNALIGFLYFRSRPFVDHPVMLLIHKSGADKSFPSDHTALAFAIAMTLFFFDKRLGLLALVGAMFVGIGRIAVGVHYPSDVFVGMLVGVCSACIIHRIFFYEKH